MAGIGYTDQILMDLVFVKQLNLFIEIGCCFWVCVAVMLQAHIQEVLSLDLSQDTGCPVSLAFLSPSRKMQLVHPLDHNRCLLIYHPTI